MIMLFTDFGVGSPYQGQMKAVLHQTAPATPVVDLHADAPSFDPRNAAYLLAAYAEEFPADTVWLCVVDPGVGTRERLPVVVHSHRQWYVGPDNGLFDVLAAGDPATRAWRIIWRPPRLSNTFHGRDLFAPTAARLSLGDSSGLESLPNWREAQTLPPLDAPRIIYQDHYGNLFTGLRFAQLPTDRVLRVGDREIAHARTYGEVPPGQVFWYENAIGLVEIAVNQGSAAQVLNPRIGDPVLPACPNAPCGTTSMTRQRHG